MATTYTLTPAEYERTAERIANINDRAVKRGFTGRVDIAGETVTVQERDRVTGETWDEIYIKTTITGAPPSYGGWTLLAAIDALPISENPHDGHTFVLRYAPGVDDSTIDRSDLEAGRCQHCRTRKTNRLYTYLVRHAETGELKQVGSTCIRDFTGWDTHPVFIRTDALEDEILETSSGTADSARSPRDVLAVAHAAVRAFGWVPTRLEDLKPSTRTIVEAYFYGRSAADNELRDQLRAAVQHGKTQAATIINTLTSELTEASEYEVNLVAALRAAWVQPHHTGLVASAVNAYDRLLGDKARRNAQPDRSAVTHHGTVGEKLTVTGAISRIITVESLYGDREMVIIENDTIVVKTLSSARWVYQVDVGETVTICGAVKAHEHYRDIPQTVLTRTKLQET